MANSEANAALNSRFCLHLIGCGLSALHNRHTISYRFVTAMPSGAVFIAFSFILRAVEGIGTAMYSTASYTLLAQLFSEHKGMVVVSQPSFV